MAWDREDQLPEYNTGGSYVAGDAEGRCSTRRIVKSSCRTEEVEPGRFVRKCEKSEQLLRECVGRPAEVVESKTEHTEHDITDEIERGLVPIEPTLPEPFTFPGLRNDLEVMEREFLGGFNDFMQSAEKMTSEFLNSFGIPSIHRSRPPFDPSYPSTDMLPECSSSKKVKDFSFQELDGEIRDV